MSEAGHWDDLSQTWLIGEITSPCINAGNPALDPSQEPMPNGKLVNIGAYGATAQASKSF